jgi:hypothetical protein
VLSVALASCALRHLWFSKSQSGNREIKRMIRDWMAQMMMSEGAVPGTSLRRSTTRYVQTSFWRTYVIHQQETIPGTMCYGFPWSTLIAYFVCLSSCYSKHYTVTMETEQLVPLNDGGSRTMKKQSSFGSDKGLETHHHGEEDTLEYRINTKSTEGKTISLWHDINLTHLDPETGKATPYYNFVCEIPKFTR